MFSPNPLASHPVPQIGQNLFAAAPTFGRRPNESAMDFPEPHPPTHTHTHTHARAETHARAHTQTHRHTDTQTHRHTDTQTHRHTDTQTHRHTDTQTHTHTCEIPPLSVLVVSHHFFCEGQDQAQWAHSRFGSCTYNCSLSGVSSSLGPTRQGHMAVAYST